VADAASVLCRPLNLLQLVTMNRWALAPVFALVTAANAVRLIKQLSDRLPFPLSVSPLPDKRTDNYSNNRQSNYKHQDAQEDPNNNGRFVLDVRSSSDNACVLR
jgi:hypothetical protein